MTARRSARRPLGASANSLTRDPTKDADYYREAGARRETQLEESLAMLTSGAVAPNAGFYCCRVHELYELALCRYSEGAALSTVREHVSSLPLALATWMELEQVARTEAIATGLSKPLARAAFMSSVYLDKLTKSPHVHHKHRNALRWTSLAYLLDLGTAPAEQMVRAVTAPGVERVLDHLCRALVPAWPVTGKVGIPDLHGPLVEVLEGGLDEAGRERQLASYMTAWRSRMRGPEFGPHMLRDHNYYGTWCLEVAAVAVLTRTSDATFRDHPMYPRDLADEGRRLRT